MEKAKLYKLFQSFSKDEINGFSKFLNSPYINESRNTAKLFEIIRQYYPEFNSRSIDPGKIYLKVFRKREAGNLNSLNNLFTRLRKLAEAYISIRGFQSNKKMNEFIYLGELKQRSLDEFFESRSKAFFEHTEPENDSDFYLYKYLIGYMGTDYLLKNIYGGKNTDPCGNIMNNLDDLLKLFYLNLFRGYSRLLINKPLFNSTTEETNKMGNIRNLAEQMPKGLDLQVLQLYRKFFSIYEPANEIDYSTLSSLLFENEEHIEREDFVLMLRMLFQFGSLVFDNGDPECGKQVFDLLKVTNRRKLWYNYNGKLSEYAFSNTILFALKLGEFDWVHKFIFDNADFIDSDNNKEIVNYNLACFHFYRALAESGDVTNDFELALDHISKVNSHFYLKKVTIFEILIITYYELDEIDLMFYQCDSYNHYLKSSRNLIPSPILLRQQNFNRFANTLGKLEPDLKEKEIEKLRKSIAQENSCAHKDWLLSKIALFRKKQKA